MKIFHGFLGGRKLAKNDGYLNNAPTETLSNKNGLSNPYELVARTNTRKQ